MGDTEDFLEHASYREDFIITPVVLHIVVILQQNKGILRYYNIHKSN